MTTILVPPLLCSPQVYSPVLDTVWSFGAVTVADTRRDTTLAGMAARLLRDAPERFTLIGVSMGGYVALEVMRQAPERVEGLALVSTSARADTPEQRDARTRQSALVRAGQFDALVDAAFRGVVAERNETDTRLKDVWRAMAEAVGQDAFLQQQDAVMQRRDSRDLLPAIHCPTVVLHGAEDRLIPPADGREVAEMIPGAEFRMIERAGHFLLLEEPASADAALHAFLSTVHDHHH